MNDKLLNFLGLCRRAGKLTIGNDAVVEAVRNREARLVLTAGDVSANTEKKLRRVCDGCGTKCIRLNQSKDEISYAIGKLAAVMAVCDDGFARRLTELSANETGGNCE